MVWPAALAVDGAALPGRTGLGYFDTFLPKYSPDGSELWTRQFGTTDYDLAWEVAVDLSGNAYVCAEMGAALSGQVSSGHIDAYVLKYDADGGAIWARQFGSGSLDRLMGVSIGASGSVLLSGLTFGAL